METALVALALLLLLAMLALWAGLAATGHWRWSRRATVNAATFLAGAIVVALLVAVALFGSLALSLGWPVLGMTVVASGCTLIILDLFASRSSGWSARHSPRATKDRRQGSWIALWRQYRRKIVPAWMREALGDRIIKIDGTPWQLDTQGRLVPAGTSANKPMDSLFDWLDQVLEH